MTNRALAAEITTGGVGVDRKPHPRRSAGAAPGLEPGGLRTRYLVESASVATIAAEAGVIACTVYRALHRHGIPYRGKAGCRPVADLDRTWLARRLKTGRSLQAIAADAGVDRSTVEWELARHRLLDVSGEPRASRAAQLYLAGASLRQVAAEIGIGRRRVTVWLMALGVSIRAPGGP